MNIICHIPKFLPEHNSGGEWHMYEILRYLKKENEIKVIIDAVTNTIGTTEFDGMQVLEQNDRETLDLYRWADVVITHLGKAGYCWNKTNILGMPLFHVIHNTYRNSICAVRKEQRAIYNAKWAKEALEFPQKTMICRPIPFVKDYEVDRKGAKAITLFNLNENKGGHVLKEIALALPKRKFIGVRGAYGDQVLDQPGNVEIVDNTNDIKPVLARTKILLMPSKYESWGRIGLEASCSGIPIIAHRTPGIEEALSISATYCDRNDVEQWLKAISNIDKNYLYCSQQSKKRAVTMENSHDYKNIQEFLTLNQHK